LLSTSGGRVPREDIEFISEGETVRGWLYRPDAASDDPPPAVVLAGGWCYVRELVMPHYAARFAAAGIAALVFDYRNLGVSDGAVRQHLDPWAQIRDYQNALSYLESRGDVDAARLGAWGISYSGGHVLILAAIDPRVQAIVSQIPVVDGYRNMRRVHGTIGYRKLWDVVLEDRRQRYVDPSKRLFIPHATAEPDRDLSTWPFPETYHTFKALKDSDAPLYENRSTVESVDLLLNYDVSPFVQRIYATPTLMIVASGDDLTLWDLEIAAYNALPTADKKLTVLPHTTHMTLYSDRSKLEVAAQAATEWFTSRLLNPSR
jgi:cephalosporin-C deacetylase-like acetyl esterase